MNQTDGNIYIHLECAVAHLDLKSHSLINNTLNIKSQHNQHI